MGSNESKALLEFISDGKQARSNEYMMMDFFSIIVWSLKDILSFDFKSEPLFFQIECN